MPTSRPRTRRASAAIGWPPPGAPSPAHPLGAPACGTKWRRRRPAGCRGPGVARRSWPVGEGRRSRWTCRAGPSSSCPFPPSSAGPAWGSAPPGPARCLSPPPSPLRGSPGPAWPAPGSPAARLAGAGCRPWGAAGVLLLGRHRRLSRPDPREVLGSSAVTGIGVGGRVRPGEPVRAAASEPAGCCCSAPVGASACPGTGSPPVLRFSSEAVPGHWRLLPSLQRCLCASATNVCACKVILQCVAVDTVRPVAKRGPVGEHHYMPWRAKCFLAVTTRYWCGWWCQTGETCS